MNRTLLCAVLIASCFSGTACADQTAGVLEQGRAAPTLRAPDVPYEPSAPQVVHAMLKLANVGAGDVVYDLGCGDGRIVIAAVRDFGARGVCVDIDPQRIRESRANAERSGIAERIVFLHQDLFETGLAGAMVVTLFLSPDVNLKLRPKLWRELKPSARIVSYVHDMGDWAPQKVQNVEGDYGPRKLHLWIIPPDAGR